jgi:hypothetical protein
LKPPELVFFQLAERAKKNQIFIYTLDESTDKADTAQLLVFVRGVD